MSGGSLDYAYTRVDDAADRLSSDGRPLYMAFAAHLRLVSKALHDVEWVLSCDYGPGDEVAAIRAVIPKGAEIDAAIANAEAAQRDLTAALALIRSTIDEARPPFAITQSAEGWARVLGCTEQEARRALDNLIAKGLIVEAQDAR